jgi:hypothetical protein
VKSKKITENDAIQQIKNKKLTKNAQRKISYKLKMKINSDYEYYLKNVHKKLLIDITI